MFKRSASLMTSSLALLVSSASSGMSAMDKLHRSMSLGGFQRITGARGVVVEGRVHQGVGTIWSANGKRECERRRRQGAHHLQRLSHRPGTVKPRHIFGSEPTA